MTGDSIRNRRSVVGKVRDCVGALCRYRLATALLACLLPIPIGPASAHPARPEQQQFVSPEQAVEALSAAWLSGQKAELLKIFGAAGEKLVSSGDPVAEKQARDRLASAYEERHRIEAGGSDKAVLILGNDAWPYPIPLVRHAAGWQFDVKAGAEQILDRRIGRNELNAIGVCRAYVEAQRDYAAKDRLGDGLHEFAQKVRSSGVKHDGLYWQAAGTDEESPLGPLVAAADAHGYGPASAESRAPFAGHYYRILTRQGRNAPGGARSYIVDGHMTQGFALIAFPAKYGNSGVMTFVVNQSGIVFEKNLGPHTANIARSISSYNPDRTWKIVTP